MSGVVAMAYNISRGVDVGRKQFTRYAASAAGFNVTFGLTFLSSLPFVLVSMIFDTCGEVWTKRSMRTINPMTRARPARRGRDDDPSSIVCLRSFASGVCVGRGGEKLLHHSLCLHVEVEFFLFNFNIQQQASSCYLLALRERYSCRWAESAAAERRAQRHKYHQAEIREAKGRGERYFN